MTIMANEIEKAIKEHRDSRLRYETKRAKLFNEEPQEWWLEDALGETETKIDIKPELSDGKGNPTQDVIDQHNPLEKNRLRKPE